MAQRTTLQGRCHCGNLELVFETAMRSDDLPLRACQCSFCVRHGARTTADPRGRATLICHDATGLVRYQFGLKTAEFFVCAYCGVYVAATISIDGTTYSTINVNTLEPHGRFTRAATPVSYDGEAREQRVARRKQTWTPTELRVGTG
jgi:hypothetical protein